MLPDVSFCHVTTYRLLPAQATDGLVSLLTPQLAAFKAGSEVTPDVLAEVGFVKSAKLPVVVLGGGELPHALTVKAHRFSKSAQQKIKAAGGTVEVLPFEKKRGHSTKGRNNP